MIRATGADVLILLIGMIGRNSVEDVLPPPYSQILLDCGQSNTRRIVSQLAQNLMEIDSCLPAAVPSFHAVTGTDYTTAFYGKGKSKPWNVLMKNPDFIQWFMSLGKCENIDESEGERFVLEMYSLGECTNLNTARHKKLCLLAVLKAGKIKINSKQLRKVDSSLLPPCRKVWQKKLLRCQYISKLWYLQINGTYRWYRQP